MTGDFLARPDQPTSQGKASLVWLRDDLRLDDNPALTAAAQTGPVALLYILEDGIDGYRALGGAAQWWLHHSLYSLKRSAEALGVPLILRCGDPRLLVAETAHALDAGAVHWNRRYQAWAKPVDASIKADLTAQGIQATSHKGSVMVEPWEVKTGSGGPYKVFTPFFRAAQPLCDQWADHILPVPVMEGAKAGQIVSDDSAQWSLLPTKPDWSAGLQGEWTPGETGAADRLDRFLAKALKGYKDDRNLPSVLATSKLSPHLRFGEISVRRVWAATRAAMAKDASLAKDGQHFLSELGWREFSVGLIHHFEDFTDQSWKAEFRAFPWSTDKQALVRWQEGQTGYPIVDAGMRELWATGWMHNRVRMVVGSFLVKHLLQDWRAGEAWFWDTLVDADTANNAAGWQWIAGCGADAAPYFRIFNPMTQGEKFDADGAYVRKWVPELARMPQALIHRPFEAPREVLAAAGVRLGQTYPLPLVDHTFARTRALAALASLKTTPLGEAA